MNMGACIRCGYDLRATALDSPCPECGLAAHRSVIFHQHPDDCPPKWVWSVAIGSGMLLVSYLAVVFLFVIAALMIDTDTNAWNVARICIIEIATLIHFVANILLSREDRIRPFKWTSFLHRWALRVLSFIPIVSAVGVAFVFLDWSRPPVVVQICLTLSFVIIFLCPIFTFLRLRSISLRLQRPRLAEHLMIVGIGNVIAPLILVATIIIADSKTPVVTTLQWSVEVTATVLIALFALWSVLLLYLTTIRFFDSARKARANWDAADAARQS